MTMYSDLEWIQRLKQGNSRAEYDLWRLLYAYGITLLRKGRYFLRPYDDASNDLIHQATLSAYQRIIKRGIHQYRFEAPFESFCKHIFVNEVRRAQTAQGRIERRVADLGEGLVGAEDVQVIQDPALIQSRLAPCLDQLLPREREIIDLHYFQGLTSEAIGLRLNLVRNTVDVICMRARRRLRECLQKRGYKTSGDLQTRL